MAHALAARHRRGRVRRHGASVTPDRVGPAWHSGRCPARHGSWCRRSAGDPRTHRRPPHRRRGGRSRSRVRCRSSTIRGEGSGFAWAGYMRLLTLVICLLAATACDETVPAALRWSWRAVHARAGERARVEGTELQLQFLEVTGDSRCPADAVHPGWGCPGPRARERRDDDALRTPHGGQQPRHALRRGGYLIELVELQPYPFSSRPIQPGDYRATLVVSRR